MNVPGTRQKDKIVDNAFRENFAVLLKSWESKQRCRKERKSLNRKKKVIRWNKKLATRDRNQRRGSNALVPRYNVHTI